MQDKFHWPRPMRHVKRLRWQWRCPLMLLLMELTCVKIFLALSRHSEHIFSTPSLHIYIYISLAASPPQLPSPFTHMWQCGKSLVAVIVLAFARACVVINFWVIWQGKQTKADEGKREREIGRFVLSSVANLIYNHATFQPATCCK